MGIGLAAARRVALMVAVVLSGGGLAAEDLAQRVDRLSRENQILADRLETMERELGHLRELLTAAGLVKGEPGEPPRPTPPAPEPVTREAVGRPAIQPYGRVDVILTRDHSPPVDQSSSRDPLGYHVLDLSPRNTRLGLRVDGPRGGAAPAMSGRVEMDFNGVGSSEFTSSLRLRHAWFQLAWAGSGFEILAGQTDDVIAPLSTDSIGYPIESWTGDLGYRRPQIRFTSTRTLGEAVNVSLQAAYANTFAELGEWSGDNRGRSARVPMFQGRVGLSGASTDGRSPSLGLFGHWGKKRYRVDSQVDRLLLRTWSAGVDLSLPLSERWLLQTEWWTGTAMDTYYWQLIGLTADGIGGGLALTHRQVVTGGWVNLTWQPTPRMRWNAGFGLDRPRDHGPEQERMARTYSWFGNVFHRLWDNWEWGAECSWWRSERVGRPTDNRARTQILLRYGF